MQTPKMPKSTQCLNAFRHMNREFFFHALNVCKQSNINVLFWAQLSLNHSNVT